MSSSISASAYEASCIVNAGVMYFSPALGLRALQALVQRPSPRSCVGCSPRQDSVHRYFARRTNQMQTKEGARQNGEVSVTHRCQSNLRCSLSVLIDRHIQAGLGRRIQDARRTSRSKFASCSFRVPSFGAKLRHIRSEIESMQNQTMDRLQKHETSQG